MVFCRTVFAVLFLCLAFLPAVHATDLSNSQAIVFDDGFGNTLPYRLFFPPGHDAPGASFPLVLFLHGSGEIGNDNLSQVTSHIDGLIETLVHQPKYSFIKLLTGKNLAWCF